MTDSAQRPIPAPPITPGNARFYEAAREGTLLVGLCRECGAYHFYPRALCPHCMSERTDWVAAKGTGTVYACSTMRRGAPAPYTVAYVTLDEGVSMLTNLVDCNPDEVAIGQHVRVVFEDAEDGTTVPMFTPTSD